MKTMSNVTELKMPEVGCLTSKPANVEAFLVALANDASHRTYYAACEDTFDEMALDARSTKTARVRKES